MASLENMFEQLATLLKIAVDNAHRPPEGVLPSYIDQTMENMFHAVAELDKRTNQELEKAGLLAIAQQRVKGEDPQIPEKEARLLTQSKELIQEAGILKLALNVAVQNPDLALKIAEGKNLDKLNTKNEKKKISKRKQKFKRAGGNSNWKPL